MTLEQFRTDRGLTYLQLADLVGLRGGSRARTIQRYCAGARFPDPDMLLSIRMATDGAVTADDFVNQHTASPFPEATTETKPTGPLIGPPTVSEPKAEAA